MRGFNMIVLCMSFISCAVGQVTIDFEEYEISVDSFLNGSDGSGMFNSETISLPNNYDEEFASWIGWSISSITDNMTPGFGNQYSAIPGSGFEESQNYAVSFEFGENKIRLNEEANVIDGFYITNNTYTYLSMRDGDAFAKKFGGETGNDPDFFVLKIKGYKNGELKADSINFYLADYRFEDNSEDYLIDDWTFVDGSILGQVDSIGLSLSSSDVGQFGMNTPAYFCLDNITTSLRMTTSTENMDFSDLVDIYPNPTTDGLFITQQLEDKIQLSLFTQTGQLIYNQEVRENAKIDMKRLPAGMYYVQLKGVGNNMTFPIIKE